MLKAFSELWFNSALRLTTAHIECQNELWEQAGVFLDNKTPAIKALNGRKVPSGTPSSRLPGTWTRSHYSSTVDTVTPRRRLAYWLFVPEQLAAQQKAFPVVVMLHGCGQTAADFAGGTRMNALAVQQGFAVMYPQQLASDHASRCWPWYEQLLQRGGGEVALVAGAIEKVVADHSLDRTRVYLVGLSAGAALAQLVALHHPYLIAALCSHSGPVYGAADSRIGAFSVMQHGSRDAVRPIMHLLDEQPDFPGMPILIVHGDQDTVVRPTNALQLAWQFCQANVISTSAHEPLVACSATGNCDSYRITDYYQHQKLMIRLCQIRHLTHAWSGGDIAFRFNAEHGPDASSMLWEFFKKHVRLGNAGNAPFTSG